MMGWVTDGGTSKRGMCDAAFNGAVYDSRIDTMTGALTGFGENLDNRLLLRAMKAFLPLEHAT